MAWAFAARRRAGAERTLLLGARATRTWSRLHADRLGAAAERSRLGALDRNLARCAAGGGAGDLCRSHARHVSLRQRGRPAPRCLLVHCPQPNGATVAAGAGGAARHAHRAGGAQQYFGRWYCRRDKRVRPHHLRLLRRRPEYAQRRHRQSPPDQRRRDRRRLTRRHQLRLVHPRAQGDPERARAQGRVCQTRSDVT